MKNYTEDRKALCTSPKCQTCLDICKETRNCLSMHSRQDVAYFGVDMTKDPPEKKEFYYNCRQVQMSIEPFEMKVENKFMMNYNVI